MTKQPWFRRRPRTIVLPDVNADPNVLPPPSAITPPLPAVDRLEAIALQPGDILVAHLSDGVTPSDFDRVRAALVDEFNGTHVVVLAGIDLTAYRPIREPRGTPPPRPRPEPHRNPSESPEVPPPNPFGSEGWRCPICGERSDGYGVERRRVGRIPWKRRVHIECLEQVRSQA